MKADDDLKRLYARLTRERAADRTDCVEPEALAALVVDRLDEAERLRLLGHISSCAACDAELRLVWAAADAGRRLGTRRFPALAIAASVVAVLLGSVAVWQALEREHDATLRSVPGEIALVAPVESEHRADGIEFVWRPVPGAFRYQLELLDAEGGLVFSASSEDTVLALPDTLSLTAGEYRWWVRAVRQDGSQMRSRALPFRIRSP